jgi:hypothetical protein
VYNSVYNSVYNRTLKFLYKVNKMKIGLSYSRCIRDIIDGKVEIRDVLVIVARTDFDPRNDEQWKGIWRGYAGGQNTISMFSAPEWSAYPVTDEQKFRDVTLELYDAGKLHQPRQYGAHPRRLDYVWLDTFAPNEEIAKNPAAARAWDNYKLLAGLS